jgi:hypothetical protein
MAVAHVSEERFAKLSGHFQVYSFAGASRLTVVSIPSKSSVHRRIEIPCSRS